MALLPPLNSVKTLTSSSTILYCFGSGSSGNCYYLWSNGQGLLIDLGLSLRTFKKHFRTFGLSFGEIQSIFVTHDHTDHVKGVGALSTEFRIPVYTSKEVHEGMNRNCFMTKKVRQEERRILLPHTPVAIGGFEVTPFPVPHDSSGNNGYYIRFGEHSLCLITDAGQVTEEMGSYLSRSENIILEANYDATMLQNGPYPPFLKRRIQGDAGHLCNTDTATALVNYAPKTLKQVWLCHLSEENNHPELARAIVRQALEDKGFSIHREGLQLHVLRRHAPDQFCL